MTDTGLFAFLFAFLVQPDVRTVPGDGLRHRPLSTCFASGKPNLLNLGGADPNRQKATTCGEPSKQFFSLLCFRNLPRFVATSTTNLLRSRPSGRSAGLAEPREIQSDEIRLGNRAARSSRRSESTAGLGVEDQAEIILG